MMPQHADFHALTTHCQAKIDRTVRQLEQEANRLEREARRPAEASNAPIVRVPRSHQAGPPSFHLTNELA
jgi:hypothetical protein